MALMVSPAGDMEVQLTRVGVEKGRFFIGGQIGVWDANIHLTPAEVRSLIKLMLKWPVMKFVILLPFTKSPPKP